MARWHEAEIDDRKILDYLLSTDHPIGADKAAFFTSIGYSREDWTRLRDDLMLMCEQGEVVAEEQTPFGIKYVVDGLVKLLLAGTSSCGRFGSVRNQGIGLDW